MTEKLSNVLIEWKPRNKALIRNKHIFFVFFVFIRRLICHFYLIPLCNGDMYINRSSSIRSAAPLPSLPSPRLHYTFSLGSSMAMAHLRPSPETISIFIHLHQNPFLVCPVPVLYFCQWRPLFPPIRSILSSFSLYPTRTSCVTATAVAARTQRN